MSRSARTTVNRERPSAGLWGSMEAPPPTRESTARRQASRWPIHFSRQNCPSVAAYATDESAPHVARATHPTVPSSLAVGPLIVLIAAFQWHSHCQAATEYIAGMSLVCADLVLRRWEKGGTAGRCALLVQVALGRQPGQASVG